MEDVLLKLNEQQRIAVTHEDGPAIVVAGAGTGKTTVIVNRILWLIKQQNIKPEEILALTFTDKASSEMEERIDKLLPYGYLNLWINTFHKFCEKILKQDGIEIGLRTDFKILSEIELLIFVRNNLNEFSLDYFKPKSDPTKFIESLIKHFSRCKDENISSEFYFQKIEELKLNNDVINFFGLSEIINDLDNNEKEQVIKSTILKYTELANAYQKYQNLMADNNYLDFGDIINLTIKLFKERPSVLAFYKKSFKYILVDEFQDTNTVQYELVKLLCNSKQNLMVVGDDDQSIYRFRGASIQNIMQFNDDFPNAKQIVLGDNYRSSQEILDIAHKSISNNNPYRLEEKLKINKQLKSHSIKKGIIEHLTAPTSELEVELVVNKILQIKNDFPDYKWSDFAILMRANNHASPFVHLFEQKNIPFKFVASKGLYLKPIILDLISYLKILYNHHDNSAFYRVLNIPSFRINYEDIVTLIHYAHQKGLSYYDCLQQMTIIPKISIEGKAVFSLVITLLHRHSRLIQEKTPISEIMIMFLNEVFKENSNDDNRSYNKFLIQENTENTIDNLYALKHLEQFHKKLRRFEESYSSEYNGVKEFLEFLNWEIEAGDTGTLHSEEEADCDKISIMTIHSSKGLEFKCVFVINMVDKRFPSIQRREAIELPIGFFKKDTLQINVPENHHLHEERRLFYVAITRAKEQLYFTSSLNYGGSREKKLSIFLTELDYTLNDNQKEFASWRINTILNQRSSQKINTESFNIQDYIPNKFSFTQLKDFLNCPLQYKYKYILKVQTKGNWHSSFGNSLHLTLEKFTKEIIQQKSKSQTDIFSDNSNNYIPTFEKLLEFYEKSWINNWYQTKENQEKYKNEGKKILKKFYNEFLNKLPNIVYTETPFNIKLGDYTINGRIDRIDMLDDQTFEIVDYKTGTPKEKLLKDDKHQLTLYQLGVEQTQNLKIKSLTYKYLKDNSELHFELKEKDKTNFQNWAISTIDKIKQSEFNATPGIHCKNCPFNGICEFKEV